MADNSPYIQALERQRKEVKAWLAELSDPFKAPELSVGLPSSVFNAVIDVITEFKIVERGLG